MKILHVFWQLGYGGIETMLVNIANEQACMGIDVNIVVINDNNEKVLVDLLNNRIGFFNLRRELKSHSPLFIIRFNRLLSFINPDVIHLHASSFYAIILSKKFRERTCVTLHDVPIGKMTYSGIFNYLPSLFKFRVYGNVACINKIPLVLSISDSVKKDLNTKYHVNSEVVYNGINTSLFIPRSERQCGNIMKIVMVSRLEHEKKGQDLLIDAAYKLNGLIDITFIGAGESLNYLSNKVKKLKMDKFIHFLGKKTQEYISNHLCEYDLFCQPSRWEGFGLTVAEAMTAQLPVLVSHGQGPAEISCGNRYGWVFENGNVNDLKMKIQYIQSHYSVALDKAVRARQYVIENFDVKETTRKYITHYTLLIEKNK